VDIRESIRQILQAKDELGVMFYEHFLEKYPELQKHFQDIDLKRQSTLLVTALMIIERHWTDPRTGTELYLRHLGTKHKDFGIPEDAYESWLEAMLETMQKFHGQDWTPSVESQWRQAFDLAIQNILRGYAQRVSV
jgi:hemoglobin-like flavoprotein